MTFRETLDKHVQAIQKRDPSALRETLPDRELVLITSDGCLVRSAEEFLALHAEWFAQRSWSLEFEPIKTWESQDLGVAVFHLVYRDTLPDGRKLHETSYLTLVFARQGERWVMVQDQNTPIKKPSA
jgi:ketosteroid isomerase-like protein